MTDTEFTRITCYLKKHYGIDMTHKKTIVEGRLENYLLTSKFNNYDEFINEVERNPQGQTTNDMINLLTTNHTYFMREAEQFEFFRKEVIPKLYEKHKNEKNLNIWCGAASTGEEPYTLAMLLQDYFSLYPDWDTKILATDVSSRVLEIAGRGTYQKEKVAQIPISWRRRYFTAKDDGTYEVNESLKNEVLFRRFNLLDPFPFRNKMHAIFLRNVMIYFADDTKNELLKKIYDVLEPGGFLFIGLTETLDKDLTGFRYVCPSIYIK